MSDYLSIVRPAERRTAPGRPPGRGLLPHPRPKAVLSGKFGGPNEFHPFLGKKLS
jgi:hypothetical protein